MANIAKPPPAINYVAGREAIVIRDIPDANPPPTEGLLWPRFDVLLPADD